MVRLLHPYGILDSIHATRLKRMKKMSNDSQIDVSSNEKNEGRSSKRAALKKIGIAIPAIITLSSRPAYGAGFCSLSGFASVNASGVARHANEHCGGFSQGGWSTPYSGDGVWPAGCVPNPISEHEAPHKLTTLTKLIQALAVPGNTIAFDRSVVEPTLFYSIDTFSMGPDVIPANWPGALGFTLHDALLYGDELAREAVAAFLNAKTNLPDFHFSVDQVRDLFKDGQTWINGQWVPSPALNAAEFIQLFQAAQH